MDKNKASEGTKVVKEQKEQAATAADSPKDALAKQLDGYKDSLQRLQAEFENYKKRVEKEKQQFRQFAAAEAVKSFLPVLDSFELALKSVNAGGSGSNEKVVRGLELLYAQFHSVLEGFGLRPMKAVGERLDPYRHEVLMQEETNDEKKDGIVAEEFQKGYLLNDVVLRCSKVKVLRFSAGSGREDNTKK